MLRTAVPCFATILEPFTFKSLIKTTESTSKITPLLSLWMTLFSSSSSSPVAWAQAKVSSSNTFGRLILRPTCRTQTAQHSPRHYLYCSMLAPHAVVKHLQCLDLHYPVFRFGQYRYCIPLSNPPFLVGSTSYTLGFQLLHKVHISIRFCLISILIVEICYDLAKIRLFKYFL
jgi:hypothetical protein